MDRCEGAAASARSSSLTGRLRLTPLAEADIQETHDWYERQREGLGKRFVLAADEVMQRIARAPDQFPQVVLDVRGADLRRFPYRVFYRVEADGSVVIACLHHRRRPDLALIRALGRKAEP